MSIGIGGKAKKVLEDDQCVIFEYAGYNWNDPKYKNLDNGLDGIITIQKDCFVESDVHEKVKRWPSGRKEVITKRVRVRVPYDELFSKGAVKVENCSDCWEKSEDGIDVIALQIIIGLFNEYQEIGTIPNRFNYHV